jgi:two-component system response regulator YesN
MSIKVLIVDDEKLERVLIKKGFAWEEHGFEVIGEAQSGAEALAFMTSNRPDIVLTDINMPNIDGLEFIEKAKDEFSHYQTKYVIITGYRDFEYAQKALRLGVEDFLLKPINIQNINEVMLKLKEKMESDALEIQKIHQLKESADKNKLILRESFLQRLVENHISKPEAISKLQAYGYEELQKQSVCCNIQLDQGMDENVRKEYNLKVLDILDAMQIGFDVAFIHYLGNTIVYFSSVNYDAIIQAMNMVKDKVSHLLSMNVSIGISQVCTDYEGIHQAYQEAEKALNARMMLDEDRCVLYKDYLDCKQTVNLADMDWEDFIFSVQNGLEQQVDTFVDTYITEIRNSGNMDLQWLKFMTINILTKAESVLHKQGKSLSSLKELKRFDEDVDEIASIDEMEGVIRQTLQIIMEFNKNRTPKKGKHVIEQALEVIDAHIFDPEMSLSFVASKIFVNDSYLSRVFKQETGQALTAYVMKKRIDESIRLLNTTNLKVYEIAEHIGISNAHYFSICFKKQMGMTIKQYKESRE